MSDRTGTSLAAPPPSTAPGVTAPPGTRWSVRRAGAVAGISLLLMVAVAVFAKFIVLDGMITPGDAAATTAEIAENEGTFRLGVLAWLVVVVLDVVVSWALYRVFRPVSAAISMLAAAFRLVYTAVLLVAVGQLLRALDVLGSDTSAAGFSAEQVSSDVMRELSAFQGIWDVGLLLFGVHLVLLGYLTIRSTFVPTVIGALLLLNGASYAFDTTAAVLALDLPFRVATFTFLGELSVALWLLFAGARLRSVDTAPATGVRDAR